MSKLSAGLSLYINLRAQSDLPGDAANLHQGNVLYAQLI
jgi:hypothetical protein